MMCPLLMLCSELINTDCTKGNCAWYDSSEKVCCFLAIKMEIVRLTEATQRMK